MIIAANFDDFPDFPPGFSVFWNKNDDVHDLGNQLPDFGGVEWVASDQPFQPHSA